MADLNGWYGVAVGRRGDAIESVWEREDGNLALLRSEFLPLDGGWRLVMLTVGTGRTRLNPLGPWSTLAGIGVRAFLARWPSSNPAREEDDKRQHRWLFEPRRRARELQEWGDAQLNEQMDSFLSRPIGTEV